MDKYCRLYSPNPKVTEFCKKWMSIATDHCLNLTAEYYTQRSRSSWMSFYMPNKNTELAIQFIPGKMPPSMMTLRDCQRFFSDIVEEIVMDNGTDNLLGALIDSVLGVLVIVTFITIVTLMLRKRQEIMQIFAIFKEPKKLHNANEVRKTVYGEDGRSKITKPEQLSAQEESKKKVRFAEAQDGRGDREPVQV